MSDPKRTFVVITTQELLAALKDMIEHIELMGDDQSKSDVGYLKDAAKDVEEFLKGDKRA